MSKIAIFASGNGSNAEKIIEYFNAKQGSIQVDCVLCNKREAGIYQVANAFELPIFFFSNEDFASGSPIIDFLAKRAVEWIVLAGFLRKISLELLRVYPKRIINLHPSLLPKYGGKGMYGIHVHQAVIDQGEKESGISIHLVNEEYDKGRILLQKTCSIEKNETVESLSKKIQQLEHQFFPIAIENEINTINQ